MSKDKKTISSYTVSKLGRFFETQCIYRRRTFNVLYYFYIHR